jgi:hypothetical protein
MEPIMIYRNSKSNTRISGARPNEGGNAVGVGRMRDKTFRLTDSGTTGGDAALWNARPGACVTRYPGRLNRQLVTILTRPAYREKLATLGFPS